MARPKKTGLDYFSADVNIFRDRKIKRLMRKHNGAGFTVFFYLLTTIYSDEGYFYTWDKHSAFDVSDDLNLEENQVEQIVNYCLELGLFDKSKFDNFNILTSKAIQLRWQKIVVDAKRSVTEINPSFELITEETPQSSEETPQTSEESSKIGEESTQRKGKERKGKDSTVDSVAPVGANDSEQVSESLAIAHRVATNLLDAIKQYDPTHRYNSNLPSLSSWIKDIDRAVRIDKRTEEQLNYVIDYIFKANGRNSAFWAGNIESGKKLREKFDTIKNQIKQETKNHTNEDAIIDSLYAY